MTTIGRSVRKGTLMAIAAGVLVAQAPAAHAASREAAALQRALGPDVRVAEHRETGLVRFVGAAPGKPIERPAGLPASAGAAQVARTFLERRGGAFGIDDAGAELRLLATETLPAGRSAVRFEQLHDGVPVLGGELVVGLGPGGAVLSASGEALPDPDVATAPAVGAQAARDAAVASVAKGEGVPLATLRGSAPSLSVYDPAILGGRDPLGARLVWRLEVTGTGSGGEPVDRLVLVDAQLGSVALTIEQIEQAKNRRTCDAGNAVAQVPCTAPVRTETGPPSAVADVESAHRFAGDTYDLFAALGRDSLDGAGMPLVSTVRYCPSTSASNCPYANAFWNGAQMVYGAGFAAADDVVGHELAHGFTDFTSRLFYYFQSGAINESLSDVFGELVDLRNGAGTDTAGVRWQLGEDVPDSGAIRDMRNPPAFGDPDRMTSPNYTADVNERDEGGVHTNSGVNNKAAFLITDGGSFNGRTVTGIGADKAMRVYYTAATTLLTSASDYADLGTALPQACANLVGTAGVSPADCTQVSAAVAAVEMGTELPAVRTSQAPVCAPGFTPTDLFADDLEDPARGAWATTSTGNGVGWYYPQNPNPFIDATYATSGDTNFWGYNRPAAGLASVAMTGSVAIPAQGSQFLRFDHAYGFEDNGAAAYDGGVLEYSVDGGANWVDTGPLLTDGGYTDTIEAGFGNPLAGRQAFTAESRGYGSSRADLSSLRGRSVRFRFVIGTDSGYDDYGWFVDDVRIYTCTPPALSVDDVSVVEGTGAGGTARFTVRVAQPTDVPVSVSYASQPGTASSPADFTATTGSVTLAAGQRTATVDVPVAGDAEDEPDETFALDLSGPSAGASLADPTGLATILDDDAPSAPGGAGEGGGGGGGAGGGGTGGSGAGGAGAGGAGAGAGGAGSTSPTSTPGSGVAGTLNAATLSSARARPCRITGRRSKLRLSCRLTGFEAVSRVGVKVTRGKRTVLSGTARPDRSGVLKLKPRRKLRRGSYRVTLTLRDARSKTRKLTTRLKV